MFGLFKKRGIQAGLEECRNKPGALLIDVREPEEFKAGHIPGAINRPLSTIDRIEIEKDIPLYLYCLRGSRSLRACGILRKMGYTDVKSIGGINRYRGEIEK